MPPIFVNGFLGNPQTQVGATKHEVPTSLLSPFPTITRQNEIATSGLRR